MSDQYATNQLTTTHLDEELRKPLAQIAAALRLPLLREKQQSWEAALDKDQPGWSSYRDFIATQVHATERVLGLRPPEKENR